MNPQHGVLPSGGVIDARGLPGTTGTSMTCTTNPWSGITTPSTVLLPQGPIVMGPTWVLPSNTHLIGAGDHDPAATGISTPGTTIQASSSTSGAMIQFASASGASGISVERLTLDGKGTSGLNGIVNQNAGTNTYVDHVTLYRLVAVGLAVGGTANNSGPYSNITFDTGTASVSQFTTCVEISGVTATHGVRHLSCTAAGSSYPTAAVALDSSNNLLKDVTISGFYAGVQVGANGPATGNVLMNIVGETKRCPLQCTPTPVETVHISSNKTSGNPNVSDLSIMGVTNNSDSGTYSILDDLTATDLTDAYVAMYVLGRPQVVNGTTLLGYSRYSTSR